MARFYESGGNVFTSATEALEKYLNDFEISTGIDLIEQSYGDWAAAPKPPPKPDDPSASLVDRIAASSETAMMPYMIQKMAERAMLDAKVSDSQETEEEDSEDEDAENTELRKENVYTCPPQPVTTYHPGPPPRSFSPSADRTCASLYADLRQLREQTSNRCWGLAGPVSGHHETYALLEELKRMNRSPDGQDAGRLSQTSDADPDPDPADLSLAVDRLSTPRLDPLRDGDVDFDTNADGVDRTEGLSSAVSSHDSGMTPSPPPPPPPPAQASSPYLLLPSSLGQPALEWPRPPSPGSSDGPPNGDAFSYGWRRRSRHDTAASTPSLASSTSRISEPKLLSMGEKEKIRVRLCELDALPTPVTLPLLFR